MIVDAVEQLPIAIDQLLGANLEAPASGARSATSALHVEGWVLGRTAPVEWLEVLQDGEPILRLAVDRPRPDLSASFADAEGAATSGYRGTLGALRLRRTFALDVRAVLGNGVRVPLAQVRGRRAPLPELPGTPPVEPLVLTSLGRTGTTWCVWLLQSHPDVVAYQPFSNDARVGPYWMSVLQTLSDPRSYLRQLFPPDGSGADAWTGDAGLSDAALGDGAMARWLAAERVDELATTCRDRITSFYHQLAERDGKPHARFFIEKHLPRRPESQLLLEAFPGGREVVLLRDLRDVFCSILAFNRKRGYQAFGRERFDSDERFIEDLAKSGAQLVRHVREAGDDAVVLRYEDLILDPVGALEPVLAFAGLDPRSAPDVVERASVTIAEMDAHMTAPSARASIGRWQRDLTPELVERCDEVLGPLLEELGYPLAGFDVEVPG